jgi:small GTP-binding protein
MFTSEQQSNTYKIVLVGDSCVGKSSIVNKFVYNSFHEFQQTTIGASFAAKNILIDNKKSRIQIWDTAGQERYRSLVPMYYRNSSAAIVVYDVTDKKTFENAIIWCEEIKKNTENCIITIVGNKYDLENQIDKKEIEEYINKNNILHTEVSAKNGINIENLFIDIVKTIKKNNINVINLNKISLNNQIVKRQNFCGWF